jgi:hypothetical protein
MSARFIIRNEDWLATLAELCPVYDDLDAVGVLTTAILGDDGDPGHSIIDGPCDIAADLLADAANEGEVDGYRIIIHPSGNLADPWLASNIERVSYRDDIDTPAKPGDSWSYDTAAIIRHAVEVANNLLAWSEYPRGGTGNEGGSR